MDQNDTNIHPRHRFVKDFKEELQKRQDDNEIIIVGLDANFPLTEVNIFTDAMKDLNLINPHASLPQLGFGPIPRTRCPGQNTIDGIFVSAGIPIKACGYLGSEYLYATQDHSCVWIDIDDRELFGHKIPQFVTPQAKRLKMSMPSVVTKFQDSVHTQVVAHKLID